MILLDYILYDLEPAYGNIANTYQHDIGILAHIHWYHRYPLKRDHWQIHNDTIVFGHSWISSEPKCFVSTGMLSQKSCQMCQRTHCSKEVVWENVPIFLSVKISTLVLLPVIWKMKLDPGEERLRQEKLPKFYHLQQICIITLGIYGVMCKILNNRRRGTVNHFFINHH